MTFHLSHQPLGRRAVAVLTAKKRSIPIRLTPKNKSLQRTGNTETPMSPKPSTPITEA